MSAKLIVPIGPAGSGKSTAAALIRLIAQERGLIVQELAFAAPIKTFCHAVFDFDAHALYGPSEARNAIDPRYSGPGRENAWKLAEERLRRNGDEFIERVLPNFDVDEYADAVENLYLWFAGLRKLPELSARVALQTLGTEWGRAHYDRIWIDALRRVVDNSPADLVVVTDGRFLNEAKESGGFPVLIVRDQVSDLKHLGAHASEKDQASEEMLDFCRRHGKIVDNNGPLDDLKRQLELIVEMVVAGATVTN